jgi:hypothetical protein
MINQEFKEFEELQEFKEAIDSTRMAKSML